VRTIVPQLYAWKGSKFLNGIVFSPVDRPGFWEVRGYHNNGDPWTEERFG
jgi:DMSO/TMAO reductase YedYZ molybdopterin-dependent catalytic subunit